MKIPFGWMWHVTSFNMLLLSEMQIHGQDHLAKQGLGMNRHWLYWQDKRWRTGAASGAEDPDSDTVAGIPANRTTTYPVLKLCLKTYLVISQWGWIINATGINPLICAPTHKTLNQPLLSPPKPHNPSTWRNPSKSFLPFHSVWWYHFKFTCNC